MSLFVLVMPLQRQCSDIFIMILSSRSLVRLEVMFSAVVI